MWSYAWGHGEHICIQGFGVKLGVIGSIPVYRDLELCLGSWGAYLYTGIWNYAWDHGEHTCIQGFRFMLGVMGSIPVYSDVELCLG